MRSRRGRRGTRCLLRVRCPGGTSGDRVGRLPRRRRPHPPRPPLLLRRRTKERQRVAQLLQKRRALRLAVEEEEEEEGEAGVAVVRGEARRIDQAVAMAPHARSLLSARQPRRAAMYLGPVDVSHWYAKDGNEYRSFVSIHTSPLPIARSGRRPGESGPSTHVDVEHEPPRRPASRIPRSKKRDTRRTCSTLPTIRHHTVAF